MVEPSQGVLGAAWLIFAADVRKAPIAKLRTRKTQAEVAAVPATQSPLLIR
jgi:hypothetical protein